MDSHDTVTLTRDCEAAVVPVGTRVTLEKGQEAYITQSLGGTYTVVVNGNMFRIDGKDADAIGKEPPPAIPAATEPGGTRTREQLDKQIQDQLKTCYDPEIPVNIADLGLIYGCEITPLELPESNKVDIKMTLTAPGCGMGPTLAQDVENKLRCIEGVDEVNVELVWEPQWNQGMMTEAAKLQLGLL